MADDDDKTNAAGRGTFVGALIAQLIVGLAAAGGLTTLLNSGHTDEVAQAAASAANEKAKVSAEAKAKEQTTKSEKAMALYLDALRPRLEAELKRIDENAERLDKDLDRCLTSVATAEKNAYAALIIAEARFGRRTVERTLGQVEDEQERDHPQPTSPAKPRVRKGARNLPSYGLAR